MKTASSYFFLIVGLFSLFEQCKKENNNTTNTITQPTCDTCLPNITTVGANTFGCKVNGKVWVSKGNNSVLAGYASFYPPNGNTNICGQHSYD
ncbi:MAG: hypothetical protein ACHQK8_04160, partial [Bacteroidia bacterium]